MTLKVDLGERFGVHQVQVVKDDISASQVAERLLQQARAQHILSKDEYRSVVQRISAHLELVINNQIRSMLADRVKQLNALEKKKQEIEQLEREKRIIQGSNCDTSMMHSA